jgi:hypothetical protein
MVKVCECKLETYINSESIPQKGGGKEIRAVSGSSTLKIGVVISVPL